MESAFHTVQLHRVENRKQFPVLQEEKSSGMEITFQCLPDSFDDGIIGQSCSKPVYRLHGMELFIVSGSRVIDLWMFHDQSVTFTNHSAA